MKYCVAWGLCNASQHGVQYFHLIEVIAEKEMSESIMGAEGCTDATVPCHLLDSFSGQCFYSMCSWVKASYICRFNRRRVFQLLWCTTLKGPECKQTDKVNATQGFLLWDCSIYEKSIRIYHVQVSILFFIYFFCISGWLFLNQQSHHSWTITGDETGRLTHLWHLMIQLLNSFFYSNVDPKPNIALL